MGTVWFYGSLRGKRCKMCGVVLSAGVTHYGQFDCMKELAKRLAERTYRGVTSFSLGMITADYKSPLDNYVEIVSADILAEVEKLAEKYR